MTVLTLRKMRPICAFCGRDLARVMGGPWFHRGDHEVRCTPAGELMAEPAAAWRWWRGNFAPRSR